MKRVFRNFLAPNPAKVFMKVTRDFLDLPSPSLKARAEAKRLVEALGEGLYDKEKGITRTK